MNRQHYSCQGLFCPGLIAAVVILSGLTPAVQANEGRPVGRVSRRRNSTANLIERFEKKIRGTVGRVWGEDI